MTLLLILPTNDNNNSLLLGEGKSLAATDEAMYEYPEVSPKSADPKMESCAAYGVVSTGHL